MWRTHSRWFLPTYLCTMVGTDVGMSIGYLPYMHTSPRNDKPPASFSVTQIETMSRSWAFPCGEHPGARGCLGPDHLSSILCTVPTDRRIWARETIPPDGFGSAIDELQCRLPCRGRLPIRARG